MLNKLKMLKMTKQKEKIKAIKTPLIQNSLIKALKIRVKNNKVL